MNRQNLFIIAIIFLWLSCVQDKNKTSDLSTENILTEPFTEFKVLDSKYITSKAEWFPAYDALESFSEEEYNQLKPLILERSIPELQSQVAGGLLTYQQITKFYLYRIKMFDRFNPNALNSIISLNPDAIKLAAEKDSLRTVQDVDIESVFGMPILLKDNINTSTMPTTAGAAVLKNNQTEEDAFITARLKEQGAIILGKTNLSEWAYFFCGSCPSGYSAIGGQTLNPYGPKLIDTGGSSSGSGVAVAANFAVAAIGSETSGSILSPSSQNNIVGLKPTVGVLSRSGIVPISSTLDTPGPMAKFAVDAKLVFEAMLGVDRADSKSFQLDVADKNSYIKGKRFGAYKDLLESDSLYKRAVNTLKKLGATIVNITPKKDSLPQFISLLNLDMRNDLSIYLKQYSNTPYKSIEAIIAFNKKDSVNRQPYGQKLFYGIINDPGNYDTLEAIKKDLKQRGEAFFNSNFETYNLDAVLSINNYHAGFAAVAEYPALTVPMGFSKNNEPKGLTFISSPKSEFKLLSWAMQFEDALPSRRLPTKYK